MTTDDELRGLATDVSQLRRRRVQIVVIDPAQAVAAPAAPAASAAPAAVALPMPRAETEPGTEAGASPHVAHDIKAAAPPAKARKSWLRPASLIDPAGFAVTAGLFIPAFLVHGDAQAALIGAGGAVLSSVSARLMDRMARGSEA
jgi:hypothetical protein